MPSKKPLPPHAYSFSASIVFGLTAIGLSLTQEDQRATTVFAVAAASCIAHGFYDLNKENRLGRAFGPLFQRHAAKISNFISGHEEKSSLKPN